MDQNLPKQIKNLIDSPELVATVEQISTESGLNIDQEGELYAEIVDILRGLNKAGDFSKHIQERLQIKSIQSSQILQKVSEKIFNVLKMKMQSGTMSNSDLAAINAPLEQAGGFTIEKNEGVNGNGNGNGSINGNGDINGITSADRPKILNDIEYPAQSKEKIVEKIPEEPHKEPLVDHLLTTPTVNAQSKVTVTAPENLPISEISETQPTTDTAGNSIQSEGPDLYREPTK
jgi:hypothetical protein